MKRTLSVVVIRISVLQALGLTRHGFIAVKTKAFNYGHRESITTKMVTYRLVESR